MKNKNEIVIISIITILILFLKLINVFQIENGLGYPFIIVLMIICFSLATIFIQKNIDKNYRINKLNYQNLNILKYISSILIIVLHLRPFLNFSNELDLAFNNIITRICVPIFFIITGYFVAKKEKENKNYIKESFFLLIFPVLRDNLLLHSNTCSFFNRGIIYGTLSYNTFLTGKTGNIIRCGKIRCVMQFFGFCTKKHTRRNRLRCKSRNMPYFFR